MNVAPYERRRFVVIDSAVKPRASEITLYLEYCSRRIANLARGYFVGSTPTVPQRKSERILALQLEGTPLVQVDAEGMVMIFRNDTLVPLVHYTYACRLTYLHAAFSFELVRKGDTLVMTSIKRVRK